MDQKVKHLRAKPEPEIRSRSRDDSSIARSSPTLILGRTGMGKSTLMARMAIVDIEAGRGVIVIDPHGDLISTIEAGLSPAGRDRIVTWHAADPETLIGLNPVEQAPPAWRGVAVAGLVENFRVIFGEQGFGPRSEHFLRNAAFLLQEQPEATMADMLRLFLDDGYRDSLIPNLTNPIVRLFWTEEFPGYPSRFRAEAMAPILNKLGGFLSDPQLARIFAEREVPIHLRQLMDQDGVLLVDLAKGRLGPGPAELLGSILLSRLTLAAMTRVELPPTDRKPFHVYVDEIRSFATPVFLSLLSETRKFGLSITVAMQFLAQMAPGMRSALLGSVGQILCFRIGVEDAKVLAAMTGTGATTQALMDLAIGEFRIIGATPG